MAILVIFLPFVAAFYNEPNAQNIAMAFGVMAVLSTLGASHSALLRRQMRFGAIAASDLSAANPAGAFSSSSSGSQSS